MFGCMLMHATMDHEGHQPVPQSRPASATTKVTSELQCTHCSFPLQQGYAFCPGCGTCLLSAACPACGQKVDPSWKACAYCGSPLGEAQEHAVHS